ncbi:MULTISPECIES: hypothetical protein [unclassified Pseudoalteromonas]|jgi:hypothetical protein|uniref:hypothetical protein n=1 Tax=unclassified Pseudoalteromonas TaxID=194690 RepID=UPI0015D56D12|nr:MULTISPECIES: hypothetical protein [unclassified Pseudoalteromonas]MCC9660980.1 hypothetical protein [Pseudoalteromonas sp. MB41]QLJ09453.1 hypothetical protein GZH31_06410 [Pseudoalteromonas sp. JSTW]
MKRVIPFLLLITSSNVFATNVIQFPKSKCSTDTFQLNIVDISFCPTRDDLKRINFLGLSNHTVTILNNDKELTIGLNPPDIAISNLHKKFNLTVHEFFLRLYTNSLKTNKLDAIKKAFDIDSSNKMKVYRKGDLFAFTITGSNVDYDRVYLNKVESEVIYQITGEFDELELLEILSRLEY